MKKQNLPRMQKKPLLQPVTIAPSEEVKRLFPDAKAYRLGKIIAHVQPGNHATGWRLAVHGKNRRPTFGEVITARDALIPEGVVMAWLDNGTENRSLRGVYLVELRQRG